MHTAHIEKRNKENKRKEKEKQEGRTEGKKKKMTSDLTTRNIHTLPIPLRQDIKYKEVGNPVFCPIHRVNHLPFTPF